MTKAEKKIRTETKKEIIRKEIFKVMKECADRNTPERMQHRVVNYTITKIMERNPQENHLVRSVCAEIMSDSKGFCEKMLKKEVENGCPAEMSNL